jgi:polysaccharide export outer membrane protein
MNSIRFLAALTFVCTSPLFAAEPSGDKKPLPEYVVEPPDVLAIELPRPVPKDYRVAASDVMNIDVANSLPDAPLHGEYMIEADGTINLGSPYGSVRVAGMTVDKVMQAIEKQLQKSIGKPDGSVELAKASRAKPVSGQYLVGPDGTINLRDYGVVQVAGKTVTEARIAVRDHLRQFLESPELFLNVAAFNSKVYYAITRKAGQGDSVRRLPITGNECVLDALAQVDGLSLSSTTKIWIARPAPHHFGHQQILPIEWDAITQGAQTTTNYQLLPGDRLYVAKKTAQLNDIVKVTVAVKSATSHGKMIHDEMNFTINCRIVDKRPNGNCVLAGNSTVRDKTGNWECSLTGEVRADDIQPDNSVGSDKIADLKIVRREAGRNQAPADQKKGEAKPAGDDYSMLEN